MAYEISSSIEAGGIVETRVDAHPSSFTRSGIPNEAGTMIAAASGRHGGASETDPGIDIYRSSSAGGWERTESIDSLNDPTAYVYAMAWYSDTELYVVDSRRNLKSYASGSSGWTTTARGTVTSGIDQHMFFNPEKTRLAVIANPSTSNSSASKVDIFHSASGTWNLITLDNTDIVAKPRGVTWPTENEIIIGMPHYGVPSNGTGIVRHFKYDGSSDWDLVSSVSGFANSTGLTRYLGTFVHYNRGSKQLLIGAADSSNAVMNIVDSSSVGYFPTSNLHLNTDVRSVIDHPDFGIESNERTDAIAQFAGENLHVDPNDENRFAIVTQAPTTGTRDDVSYVFVESGSSGYKFSQIEDNAINSTGYSYMGGMSYTGGFFVGHGTGSTSFQGFTVYENIVESDPALAAYATSSIGSSGGTLSAGGTQASPKITVTVPADALSGDTSLSTEVVSAAATKIQNLHEIKKQAGSADAAFVGDIFRFTPHGQQFSKAVTIQFVLDSEPSDLTIWKRDSHDGDFTQWYELPSGLWSNSGTTVTISTTKFSEYAGIGGINVARTKLNNSQLVTLTATDLVDSTSIRVSGSNSFKNLTVAGTDLFVIEQGGATYHVSASQMSEYFGGLVNVTSSTPQNVDLKITMVTPSDTTDVGLEVDAGLLYNPSSNKLTVSGDASVGNDLFLASDEAVINFGAGNDVSLTHVHNAGLLLNSDMQLQFRDSTEYINSDADGSMNVRAATDIALNIGGTDELLINATTATFGTNIVIPDAGTIGSATDGDAIAISAAGVVSLSAATEASAIGTAALVVAGGASVAKDLYVGDDLNLLSDAAVIGFGANSEVKLTHVHDTGLLLNGSSSLQFGDSGTYIYQSADGVLDLVADTEIEINAAAVDINGAVDISSTLNVAGTITGDTSLTLDTTTITTAELAVLDSATSNSQASKVIVTDSNGDFEMSDSDKIFFGDGADVSIHWDGTTMKIGTDTSGAPISIGHGTSEVTIQDNLTVAGNLTINGDTTTVSTTNLQVEDSLVELSDGASGAPANDQGFIFNRGASDNAALIWDESTDMFKFANVGSASADSTGNLAHASTFPLSASLFYGDGSNLTGVGAEVLAAVDGNSADLKLTFVSGAASAATFYIDSGLVFNPNTNLLTTPGNIKLPNGGEIGTVGDPNAIAIASGGAVTLSATDSASSTSSGALIVGGGVGIGEKLFVGNDASIAGATTITNSTESTSTGTGALIVYGGVGIGGDANFADDVTLKSNAAVLAFGQDSEVKLTHVHDTGLLLNGSSSLQFGDSGTYIHQSADGVLDLVSDTEIELTATTIDINGAVDASSTITAAGRVIVDDATDATSTTDGSLQTDGGLSVAKDAVLGNDVKLLSDAAVINFGANSEVKLTHVHDTGLLLNGSSSLQFGDSGTYIHQSADGVLDLVSDTEIELTATTIDINGAVDISSTLTVNTVADLTADSNDSTHHFLIMDSDDSIVKKESMSDMATEFADAAGTKGGIKVHQGKFYVAPVEDSFMSSSNNSSMSGSRPSGGAAGASGLNVTASLSVTCLSGSLMVFLNGLLQTRSGSANLAAGSNSIWDYKLDSYTAPTKVIMSDALDSDDVLIVRYIQK